MTQQTAAATDSDGAAIEANFVSSGMQVAVSASEAAGLAADTNFATNLQSAVATSMSVEASTVTVKSVTVASDGSGSLQVDYEVVI